MHFKTGLKIILQLDIVSSLVLDNTLLGLHIKYCKFVKKDVYEIDQKLVLKLKHLLLMLEEQSNSIPVSIKDIIYVFESLKTTLLITIN